ncbi:MAG: hypothetical protein ACK5M7_10560 [Draconibacterium sp.]
MSFLLYKAESVYFDRIKYIYFYIGLGETSCVGWKAHIWKSSDLISREAIENTFDLKDGIENQNLVFTASSINQRGTTIVPLNVYTNKDGELIIRANDPAYATPGPDEVQKFDLFF